MFQVTVLKFGNLLGGWKLATKFQNNIPKGTWDVNIILGRVHTKTGLVTQTGFIQTCCVQTSAVKACWNHAGSGLSNG